MVKFVKEDGYNATIYSNIYFVILKAVLTKITKTNSRNKLKTSNRVVTCNKYHYIKSSFI